MSLFQKINKIGRVLVKCSKSCNHVNCDQRLGIIPRCLILETESGKSGEVSSDSVSGCAIVGLNPGKANGMLGQSERAFYRDGQCSYESVISWFNTEGGKHQYYVRMREFAKQVGISGNILWSELAKCENAPLHVGPLPMQTYRTCVKSYLNKEIALLPQDWPLFAVGRESYKALAYIFSNRAVIGVPHPTGSRGHFHNLFNNNSIGSGGVTPKVAGDVQSAVHSRTAVWLM